VLIYVSDGLSSKAIEANAPNILPVLIEGLKDKGLKTGIPFFVKYGRVGAMDHISELTGATVTCVLIGERPGLGSAESMSAYIAYKATVGMPEANRTVVSNIYSGGIAAVEAGAYLVEIIGKIMQNKASGVNLKK
jgi:ethanolamine ammonia-lyase small subunit